MIDYAPALQFAQAGPLIGDGGVTWQCPASWVIDAAAIAYRTGCREGHYMSNGGDIVRLVRLWQDMAALIAARGIDARVTFRTWRIIAGVFVPDIEESVR